MQAVVEQAWRAHLDHQQRWSDEASSDLESVLQALAEERAPQEIDHEKRANVLAKLQKVVGQLPNSELHLKPYGSFVSGCFSRTSDLDVALEGFIRIDNNSDMRKLQQLPKNDYPRILGQIALALHDAGVVRPRSMERIFGARVPILKFVEAESGLEVDICVTTRGCDFKNAVMGVMHGLEPRLQQLVRLVKMLAKCGRGEEQLEGGMSLQSCRGFNVPSYMCRLCGTMQSRGLNDPHMGTFNSWSLSLMVLFALQLKDPGPGMLPPLSSLFTDLWDVMGWSDDLRPFNTQEQVSLEEQLQAAAARAEAKAQWWVPGSDSAAAAGVKMDSLSSMLTWFVTLYAAITRFWKDAPRSGRGWRISPWSGTVSCQPFDRPYLMGVEDPFDASDNCARTIGVTGRHDGTTDHIVWVFATAEKLLRGAPLGPKGTYAAIAWLFGQHGKEVAFRLAPDKCREWFTPRPRPPPPPVSALAHVLDTLGPYVPNGPGAGATLPGPRRAPLTVPSSVFRSGGAPRAGNPMQQGPGMGFFGTSGNANRAPPVQLPPNLDDFPPIGGSVAASEGARGAGAEGSGSSREALHAAGSAPLTGSLGVQLPGAGLSSPGAATTTNTTHAMAAANAPADPFAHAGRGSSTPAATLGASAAAVHDRAHDRAGGAGGAAGDAASPTSSTTSDGLLSTLLMQQAPGQGGPPPPPAWQQQQQQQGLAGAGGPEAQWYGTLMPPGAPDSYGMHYGQQQMGHMGHMGPLASDGVAMSSAPYAPLHHAPPQQMRMPPNMNVLAMLQAQQQQQQQQHGGPGTAGFSMPMSSGPMGPMGMMGPPGHHFYGGGPMPQGPGQGQGSGPYMPLLPPHAQQPGEPPQQQQQQQQQQQPRTSMAMAPPPGFAGHSHGPGAAGSLLMDSIVHGMGGLGLDGRGQPGWMDPPGWGPGLGGPYGPPLGFGGPDGALPHQLQQPYAWMPPLPHQQQQQQQLQGQGQQQRPQAPPGFAPVTSAAPPS